jgi:hypothetical protein
MEEVVWRKAGEERCERSYRSLASTGEAFATEKKALPGSLQTIDMAACSAAAGHVEAGLGACPVVACLVGVLGACPQLNKRETANAKMNERHLIGQSMQNPFMPNSNFATDIEVQMNFLTPQKGSF